MTSERAETASDRRFLKWVRTANLAALRRRYPKANRTWKRIAIERAIRRALDLEEKE